MSRKRLLNQTKEKFVAPKVNQTVRFELEDELLGVSKEFRNSIRATGHEEVEVSGIVDYWE